MLKLTVPGKARKKVSADCMELSIEFVGRATNTADALEKSHMQCEKFLGEMDQCGIETKDIVLKDDDISKYTYSENETVTVKRKIQLCVIAEVKLCSYIFETIKKNNFDCDYDIHFSLLDGQELHDHLLKAAVANSKTKAETIAAAMGKKVVGIETAEVSTRHYEIAARSMTIDDFKLPSFSSLHTKSG